MGYQKWQECQGYKLSSPETRLLSTNEEASALFDTLNGKNVEGCVLRTTYKREFKHSARVKVLGMKKNTSIQQLINHIKKKADIEIKAKDIWMDQMKGIDSVQIGCSDKADSLKLANALNRSELNGSKIEAEVLGTGGRSRKV